MIPLVDSFTLISYMTNEHLCLKTINCNLLPVDSSLQQRTACHKCVCLHNSYLYVAVNVLVRGRSYFRRAEQIHRGSFHFEADKLCSVKACVLPRCTHTSVISHLADWTYSLDCVGVRRSSWLTPPRLSWILSAAPASKRLLTPLWLFTVCWPRMKSAVRSMSVWLVFRTVFLHDGCFYLGNYLCFLMCSCSRVKSSRGRLRARWHETCWHKQRLMFHSLRSRMWMNNTLRDKSIF